MGLFCIDYFLSHLINCPRKQQSYKCFEKHWNWYLPDLFMNDWPNNRHTYLRTGGLIGKLHSQLGNTDLWATPVYHLLLPPHQTPSILYTLFFRVCVLDCFRWYVGLLYPHLESRVEFSPFPFPTPSLYAIKSRTHPPPSHYALSFSSPALHPLPLSLC